MPSPVARDFQLTESKILLNIWLSVSAAAASILLCLYVLVAAAYIYMRPWARHAIDRVSFRLLLWSMVFEIFYDMAFIAVGVESALGSAPNAVCATGVYFMMSTLGVVNYLCTSIAVNLMLIACFKINPLEKGLEKWYVGVSLVLGMGVPIVPAALDHFGWDPILKVCWIKAANDTQRMRYFILDLYLWQSLSCIIAVLAVVATLGSLFHQRGRSAKSLDRQRMAMPLDSENSVRSSAIFSQLENRFIKTALLISLYPISLIIVNGIITIGDLYISAEGGVFSKSVYALYCLYYFLYGGRGLTFALLGIFVDPCLRRGLEAVRSGDRSMIVHQRTEKSQASLLEILGGPSPMLESDSFQSSASAIDIGSKGPRKPSSSTIELATALARIPAEHHAEQCPATPGLTYTKSFSGVPAQALPAGLTDEVDVHIESPKSSFEEIQVEDFEPLDPDLPDAHEARLRQLRAVRVEREEALRAFEEQQAQL